MINYMYSRRNHRSFNRLEQFDLTCEIGSTQAVIDTNAIVLFTLDYFCFTGPIKPLLVLVSICLPMIVQWQKMVFGNCL